MAVGIQIFAAVLACLVCLSSGRRVYHSSPQLQSDDNTVGRYVSPLESSSAGILADASKHTLPTLATLLFSLIPSAPWSPSALRSRVVAEQSSMPMEQVLHQRSGISELRMTSPESSRALAEPGTQLDDVLNALPPDQKYNTVLMSLLAKESRNMEGAIDLVREMTSKRLRLSDDAFKKMLDTTIENGVIDDILNTFSAACENGACSAFASRQIRLPKKPTQNALMSLSELPSDDRSTEIGLALAFTLGIGALTLDELANVVDFWNAVDAPPLGYVITGLAASWAGDRYGNQGQLSDTIGRGISRLFSRDIQRESAVESASFLIGYLLGLPCCAFNPTATKPLEMLAAVGDEMSLRVGASARLIDRVLIWLMAPVAFEMSEYKSMVRSDPSLGLTFLEAARRREAELGLDVEEGGWTLDEDEQRVRWAYSEARRLVQQYSGIRKELQENMAAGVSAGECATLIEGKLKNDWGLF